MVSYSHLMKNVPQFVVMHTVKGFGIVNKAEIDVFLELFCFFDDPADFGNLISGSSAFSKTSSNLWKFMVHILLKSGLENFKHYLTSMYIFGGSLFCQQLRQSEHGLEKNFQTQNISKGRGFIRTKNKDEVGTMNAVGQPPDRPGTADSFHG